MCAIEIC